MEPDVIVAVGNPAVVAFQQLTGTIPVVFIEVGDSLGSGLVSSTARPGGNITGFELTQPSMGGKWLGVLKEAAPNMSRTAILFGSDSAANSALLQAAEAVAPSLGVQVTALDVREVEHSAHGQVYRACARSVQGFLAMTEERVRPGPETGFLAHKTPRAVSDSLGAGKRVREALATPGRPGMRKIAAWFGVNPGVGSGLAALSSRQASSPSSPSRCKAAYSGSGPV